MVNESTLGQHQPNSIFIASTTTKMSKILLCCFVLLVRLWGNIFIIIIVYKHRDLHKTVNYFNVKMAVSNFVFPVALLTVK